MCPAQVDVFGEVLAELLDADFSLLLGDGVDVGVSGALLTRSRPRTGITRRAFEPAFWQPVISEMSPRHQRRGRQLWTQLLLIHRFGAKTSIERIAPATAIPEDRESWLVAASKAG